VNAGIYAYESVVSGRLVICLIAVFLCSFVTLGWRLFDCRCLCRLLGRIVMWWVVYIVRFYIVLYVKNGSLKAISDIFVGLLVYCTQSLGLFVVLPI
jgi:hypothetical protein